MQEIDERFFQVTEIVAIGFHMVGIDVGDHGHHGQQVQERRIGLIRFDNNVVTRPEFGIGTGAVQPTADDEGGVQATLGQDARHQAGGRGFAVGTGNRNALLEPHQLRQHQRTRHDRNALFAGRQYLGVIRLHGCRGDHGINTCQVFCCVPHKGLDADARQATQRGAVRQIGA